MMHHSISLRRMSVVLPWRALPCMILLFFAVFRGARAQNSSPADSALSLIARGEAEQAIAVLVTGLRTEADKLPLYRLLGQTYYEGKNLEKALECYRQAMTLCDSCSQDLETLGAICFEADQAEAATTYFLAAVKRGSKTAEPRLAKVLFREGEARLERKDFHSAAAAFEQGLAYHEDTLTYQRLLYCYIKNREDDRLLTLGRTLLAKYPAFVFPRVTMATILYQRGNQRIEEEEYRQAIELFDSSVQLQAYNPESYFGLGYCYDKLNDTACAMANYRRADDQGSNTAQLYYNMARRQFSAGDLPDAERNVHRSILMNVQYAAAWKLLSDLYARTDDTQHSLSSLRAAAQLGCEECGRLLMSNHPEEKIDLAASPRLLSLWFPSITSAPWTKSGSPEPADTAESTESAQSDDFIRVDQEPVPVTQVAPIVPDFALRVGAEGIVWVKMWVGKDGRVKKAIILKSDNEIFNQASLDAAMKWMFSPAVMNGKPVSAWVQIPFRFRMNHR